MVLTFPVRVPRHAFSPRNAARAADLWRACQEVATDGSTAFGWPPSRYREDGIGFIVRDMIAVHYRETAHGEALTARTWVADFRRGMLTRREIRIEGPLGPLMSASQEWVHVKADPERTRPGEPPLKPARASPALLAAFAPTEGMDVIAMPTWDPIDGGPVFAFDFECWHTWMDPLGHANHPAYVDWADEAVARAVGRAGIDPVGIRAVAEAVRWRVGVKGGDQVRSTTRVIGRTAAGDAVIAVEFGLGESIAATATLVRSLSSGDGEALITALS